LKKEKFLVLRDANLKIDAGQTMEIIGQNGSGKIKSLEFKAPTISALFKKNGNFSRDNDLCHVKKWDEPRLKHRKNSIGEMSFQEY